MMKKIISVVTTLTMLFCMTSFSAKADTWTADGIRIPSRPQTSSNYVDSYIVTEGDTLLYSLPNGGVDFPHSRSYYKQNDGMALFATYDERNYDDGTGYDWYACLLVSKDADASWYYTTPTEWMGGYGATDSITFKGETWYYSHGAAMHVEEEDQPNVFHLNDVTGISVYDNPREAAFDLLQYYYENNAEDEDEPRIPSGNNSCVVTKGDTLLYSLPNGGVDFPYSRSYYKQNDGMALFATYDERNYDDGTGYDWYACLLVSKDADASWYYTTPTEWMGGYGATDSIRYEGETWYYSYGAAMHVEEEDQPNVFHLNDVTGVPVYDNAREAAMDLLDYYYGNETEYEDETEDDTKYEPEDETEYEPEDDVENIPEGEDNLVTLYYDANGGKEPPSPVTVKYGSKVKIAKDSLSRVGYEFIGWGDDEDDTEPVFKKNDNIKLTSDRTLYAIWKATGSEIILTLNDKKVSVDGVIKYNDVAPIVENSRTMVPVRFIAESFGAEVTWDDEEQCAIIVKDKDTIKVYINKDVAYINEKAYVLDSPAFSRYDRTFVPLRFIGEGLGANVEWNGDNQTVTITK